MNKQTMRDIRDDINSNKLFGDYEKSILTDLLLSMEETFHARMFDDNLERSNEIARICSQMAILFRM